jgi:hypothetical protein
VRLPVEYQFILVSRIPAKRPYQAGAVRHLDSISSRSSTVRNEDVAQADREGCRRDECRGCGDSGHNLLVIRLNNRSVSGCPAAGWPSARDRGAGLFIRRRGVVDPGQQFSEVVRRLIKRHHESQGLTDALKLASGKQGHCDKFLALHHAKETHGEQRRCLRPSYLNADRPLPMRYLVGSRKLLNH